MPFLLWIAAGDQGGEKLGFFPPPFLFWFLSDVFVIWLWFFYRRIEQGQAHLSNTLTMSGKPTKNFLGVSEKKFRLKSEVLSEYSSVIPGSFFQNLNFFRFSWHIFWLVRRMVTIFSLTHRARLGAPFKYVEHVCKAHVHRKFSRSTWKKKVSAQNMSFCQNILTWLWASFFKISIFFVFPDIQSDGCAVRSRFV